MHMAGKTEEARADLARLALIRKQREEAAKKRDLEKGILINSIPFKQLTFFCTT